MEDKFKVFYHDNGLLRQENGTPVMAVLLEKEVIGFPDKLIEIAAVEQLKAEIESRKVSYYKLDEININLNCEITALKSKLAKAKENLNIALNYLHWREDDLIGDDFKGDGKLTAEYKNKVSEIEKSISEIGGG